jgi:hypothetical protein
VVVPRRPGHNAVQYREVSCTGEVKDLNSVESVMFRNLSCPHRGAAVYQKSLLAGSVGCVKGHIIELICRIQHPSHMHINFGPDLLRSEMQRGYRVKSPKHPG